MAVQGLLTESHHFDETVADASSRAAMQRFYDLGGQTRAGEPIIDQPAARGHRTVLTPTD